MRGHPVGSVTTLRDRTELTALRRELDVSRHTTDTLRAQAHEFVNRLHTIAGLVELGEHEEVVRYITRTSELHESLDREVTQVIRDPALAALLIAKASLAAEQSVTLTIGDGTDLPPVGDRLSADLVTVVGNLVDNAFDAAGPGGTIAVTVTGADAEVVVTVTDSGPGVDPGLAERVFQQGYSTKDETAGHHGLGLAMIRLICGHRGGSVTVTGSTFTARLPFEMEVVP
jgi:sensor histidine kinase regulating citrate/malate metabolism